MSKKKTTPAPPIVLLITLQPDGNATLLTRRGELAHLSQFTYTGLQEIVAAIQSGAAELVELEANPPAIDTPPAPPAPPVAIEPEADTPTVSDEVTVADDALDEVALQAEVPAAPVAEPNRSLFARKV